MKKKISVLCIILLLGAVLPSCLAVLRPAAAEEIRSDHSADSTVETVTSDSTEETVTAAPAVQDTSFRKMPYDGYLDEHGSVPMAPREILLDAGSISGSGSAEIVSDFEGRPGQAVKTDEDGFVEYRLDVPEDGLYNINVEYYPIKGKGSRILRTVVIDGDIPFEEARELAFSRIWTDEAPMTQDAEGNDIRSRQIEAPSWCAEDLEDAEGYYAEPLKFFFSAGEHTLRFESVKEPMVIGSIRLYTAEILPSYEEVLAGYEQDGITAAAGEMIKVQGEDAVYKSDSMIYPIFDRSSPATEKSDPSVIRLNTIGGSKWQFSGQWISWNVDVPKSGLYVIAIKARQNIVNGAYSTRKLMINGKVPFREAAFIQFDYSTEWTMQTVGGDGTDYLFYFHEGRNEIRLEASLGNLATLQQQVQSCMSALNDIYRKILMITGPVPDIYRDYQFHKQIPEVLKDLSEQSERLKGLYEDYIRITGQNGEQAQILKKLYLQTQAMADDPGNIAGRFMSFKNNIVALGTWTLIAKQQPLEIDYLAVAPPGYPMPKPNATFLEQASFSIRAFLASFFKDYNSVSGSTAEGEADIRVWLGNGITGGRDQAQVLKKMIENEFTAVNGTRVDLQLVSINALLTATLAGKGPDVALTLWGSDPVNYAVRNAVADLTQFPDCAEITKRFMPSSLVPLEFNGGLYGLPESQTFYMLFYRKDILSDLSLEVPQTWDDVITMLPVLQKKQLDFGLPQVIGDTVGLGFGAYVMFLYQNGGSLYEGDGIASAIGSDKAVDAFFQWTKLYTDYNLPRQYDFINRFRVGEVPIGIADYNTYNYLSVFAPEIHGLWEFAGVPGMRQEDGSIDRSVGGSITACSIMSDTRDKEASWEFLKWWTGKDAQTEFGLELESIMGTAARYSPANIEALYQIPWSKKDFTTIMEQWKYVKGIPEVPGGYFSPRHIDFAFKKVIINGEDPGECIEDAAKAINIEITAKRMEFHLKTR